MGLLIRNGEIVTSEARYFADIYIEDQTITQIGLGLVVPEGTEVIDATGKLIFPGFIDPHVHIHLPFMGTFAKDTYETASVAALRVGANSPTSGPRSLVIAPIGATRSCRTPTWRARANTSTASTRVSTSCTTTI